MSVLGVDIAGIKMKNPVIAASGTFGFGTEYEEVFNPEELGAIVVKGITLKPRSGNKGCRIAETPGGLLNCIGLENPGIEAFVSDIFPKIKHLDVPILVNISGNTVEEYGEMAAILDKSGVHGIEINISCPNVKEGGIAFGTKAESAAEVVRMVKKSTSLPVITKLSPNVTDVAMMAKTVEAEGTDAISLINTLLGMSIDVKTGRPRLGNIVGGLSGPAVKPIAVRMVWQVAQAVNIPIIGMGGIMNGEDALEFMFAGASAISVGTGTFSDPLCMVKIAKNLQEYANENNLDHISEIVGKVNSYI